LNKCFHYPFVSECWMRALHIIGPVRFIHFRTTACMWHMFNTYMKHIRWKKTCQLTVAKRYIKQCSILLVSCWFLWIIFTVDFWNTNHTHTPLICKNNHYSL
jgi:hypothetical protein